MVISSFNLCADFRTSWGDEGDIVYWAAIENANVGRQQTGDQLLFGNMKE